MGKWLMTPQLPSLTSAGELGSIAAMAIGRTRKSPNRRDLDNLARQWRWAPRRWGHPLHSLCSYFAMFPPHVPRVFIEWLTKPGDVVYDPFSGRGTAPMEACRLGRTGLGSDANPLAYVLTGAKVDPPLLGEVVSRIETLRTDMPSDVQWDVPPDIEMLYEPNVLRQLSWLRTQLDVGNRTDRFIMATVLGLMHANYTPGSPARGLSISMPNTFSMAPTYVRKYIKEHNLKPPKVDVFDMIRRKAERMSMPDARAMRGHAWLADARNPSPASTQRARLIFTSPPYLCVIKYGKYNWIRLWMLGHEPSRVDSELMATSSLQRYLDFMSNVLKGLRVAVAPRGYVCLMIGDVRDKSGTVLNLAEIVLQQAAVPAGWRCLGVLNDQLPQERKVSRIWGHDKKGRATKIDRILILAPPGSKHTLPLKPQRNFTWKPALSWAVSPVEAT